MTTKTTKTTQARRVAYTAIVNTTGSGAPYILARCDEGEPGYSPIRDLGFASYADARGLATLKNEDAGLSAEDAARIVLSTMRPVGRRARH
jgi:hypothetical protein